MLVRFRFGKAHCCAICLFVSETKLDSELLASDTISCVSFTAYRRSPGKAGADTKNMFSSVQYKLAVSKVAAERCALFAKSLLVRQKSFVEMLVDTPS